MKSLASWLLVGATSFLATLITSLAAAPAHAAGYQYGRAADPEGKPLEIGIWYPSAAKPAPLTLGPTTIHVAVDAPVQGKNLPLVVVSHGNGGFFLSHHDTAAALADAGFVVVAVTHTGDNYADQSRSTFVMDRPRHVSRVLDHMLGTWPGRAVIDPARIGMFGFSSGAFTTLASIGGVPDFKKVGPLCAQHPGDYACGLVAKSGGNIPTMETYGTKGAADPRIKAAVVAAPALGFTFSPDGLKNVKVPVQLWRAENDMVVPHPRYAEAVRLALPQPPEYRVVANAGHFDFLAPCSSALASIAPPICSSAAGFDRAKFHTELNAAVVGFLAKAWLKN